MCIADKPFFENHRIMDTDYETYSITYICLPAGPEYSTGKLFIESRWGERWSENLAIRDCPGGAILAQYAMQMVRRPTCRRALHLSLPVECRGNSNVICVADEFLIYTREPKIPVELETKLIETLTRHYNFSLMIKPRQTDCTQRQGNSVEQGEFVFSHK